MILHNIPTLGKEEELAAIKVLKSKQLSPDKEIMKFENNLCKFLKLPKGHAVVCSSGSAALFLSLWALNAEGKKIAFPSYVCSALRHAVGLIKGREVVIDVEKNSSNTNINLIKKSKADIAIVPHLYGIPVDISKLKNLDIIEDCCHSLGARVGKFPTGLMGKMGIFSFYVTKLITTGGHGGAIVSKDLNLIEKIRDYINFDQRKDKNKRFNFQMTEIQAAIGNEQFKKLPFFLKKREKIFNYYKKSGINLLDVKQEDKKKVFPVRYRAVMVTNRQKKIIKFLRSKKINSIIPLENWELLGNSKSHPNSLKITKKTISLPIYPSLKKREQDFIIKNIQKFI